MPQRRLPGGFDGGAELVDGTVRRRAGPWTPAVQLLLSHLASVEFEGAPRQLGRDDQGREMLTLLEGQTAGSGQPWPGWVHSDQALAQVADWLRRYHAAVADFVPPPEALWRDGQIWRPGLIVTHNDAAPYNAVWNDGGLVGFVDWDMAGPMAREADLAWMAFSWVPLHARSVVAREGFTAFGERRRRLEDFLARYGWAGYLGDVCELVADRIQYQIRVMRETALAGDPTYQQMLSLGRDRDLQTSLDELEKW
jgi:Phosphotransferase enzyme family